MTYGINQSMNYREEQESQNSSWRKRAPACLFVSDFPPRPRDLSEKEPGRTREAAASLRVPVGHCERHLGKHGTGVEYGHGQQ